jgi:hypothetical protein
MARRSNVTKNRLYIGVNHDYLTRCRRGRRAGSATKLTSHLDWSLPTSTNPVIPTGAKRSGGTCFSFVGSFGGACKRTAREESAFTVLMRGPQSCGQLTVAAPKEQVPPLCSLRCAPVGMTGIGGLEDRGGKFPTRNQRPRANTSAASTTFIEPERKPSRSRVTNLKPSALKMRVNSAAKSGLSARGSSSRAISMRTMSP